MKKNQKGFSIVEGLLILVIVGIIAGVGWFVYDSNKKSEDSLSKAEQVQVDSQTNKESTVKLLTYKNDEAKLTYKYPENWKNVESEEFRYEDGEIGAVGGTITSPNNNKLTWVYSPAGGKGGDCEPEPDDKAFNVGNKCSSKQYLSFEKVQSVKMPEEFTYRNMYEDSLYITRTKYMDSEGKVSYQICLDPFYTSTTDTHDDETPQITTRMGLIFPCEFWSSGFNMKFEVDNEAGFNSTEAKIAETIMKSFNSL